ncbi:MAG: GHMP kinase [Spirochaetales bacterium]|nr:GHMP kinase [Spirochaetales bacterium]
MEKLKEMFREKFTRNEVRVVQSPLRICPLGAHVDHQHGYVTGMALDASIFLAYAPNPERYIRVQSLDFPDEEYFHLDHIPDMIPGFWGNYIRGAALSLERQYKLKVGIQGVVRGRHPIGGLSSSAAVITAYLMALCDVNGFSPSKEELIRLSHWVETDFIGLNNGILDQSANILSKKGYLMFMDCRTEQYELVPKSPRMPDYEVIVVYSGISTALMGTDYNNRVDECKVAAWILQELDSGKVSPLKQVRLRDVAPDQFEALKGSLPGRFRRRAEHFFSENQRVLKGLQLWKEGDVSGFGRLMFESGESSIRNYECGCPELITIFETLSDCDGVYGARFSGAGYRGCCIGLVDPSKKESIQEKIESVYPKKHPQYKDTFKVYYSKTGDGARILTPEEVRSFAE